MRNEILVALVACIACAGCESGTEPVGDVTDPAPRDAGQTLDYAIAADSVVDDAETANDTAGSEETREPRWEPTWRDLGSPLWDRRADVPPSIPYYRADLRWYGGSLMGCDERSPFPLCHYSYTRRPMPPHALCHTYYPHYWCDEGPEYPCYEKGQGRPPCVVVYQSEIATECRVVSIPSSPLDYTDDIWQYGGTLAVFCYDDPEATCNVLTIYDDGTESLDEGLCGVYTAPPLSDVYRLADQDVPDGVAQMRLLYGEEIAGGADGYWYTWSFPTETPEGFGSSLEYLAFVVDPIYEPTPAWIGSKIEVFILSSDLRASVRCDLVEHSSFLPVSYGEWTSSFSEETPGANKCVTHFWCLPREGAPGESCNRGTIGRTYPYRADLRTVPCDEISFDEIWLGNASWFRRP